MTRRGVLHDVPRVEDSGHTLPMAPQCALVGRVDEPRVGVLTSRNRSGGVVVVSRPPRLYRVSRVLHVGIECRVRLPVADRRLDSFRYQHLGGLTHPSGHIGDAASSGHERFCPSRNLCQNQGDDRLSLFDPNHVHLWMSRTASSVILRSTPFTMRNSAAVGSNLGRINSHFDREWPQSS